MKKYLSLLIASMFLISAVAFGETKAAAADTSSILFTQIAQSATLTPVVGKDNTYQLTLNNINKHVIWFTDRPGRNSGMIPVEKFMTAWNEGKDSFASNPPNASLVTISNSKAMPSTKEVSVIKLTNPVYDKKANSLTYTVEPVGTAHPDHLTQESLKGEVVLFVDNANWINLTGTSRPGSWNKTPPRPSVPILY